MFSELTLSTITFYLSRLILFGLLIIASYTDWRDRKIYNRHTISAFLLGLGLAALGGFPRELGEAALGSLVAFGIFFFLFVFGLMGGGDAKLAAAIGALIGYPAILDALFWGTMVGGVYALTVLLVRGGLWENVKQVFYCFWNFIYSRQVSIPKPKESKKIPYGICLSAGTLLALVLRYTYDQSVLNYLIGY